MDRRSFHRGLVLTAVTAPFVGIGSAQSLAMATERNFSTTVPQRRSLVEYALPRAEQTHEIVRVPDTPLVVVSQMSNSNLVKLWLDPDTEEITELQTFPLGPPDAMLHGLAPSTRYPGLIWATHEAGNRLLLVDPGVDRLDTPPEIVREIDVPGGGRGPHYVGEYGDLLWVSLKSSDQVLAIDHTDPQQYRLYDAQPHPIFVARHQDTGLFYASQDQASSLLRIDPDTQTTTQIAIPAEHGKTPVGLVAGPAGLWVVLLGTPEQGTGTFGRIDSSGEITWFQLTSPEINQAGLLHIAFDPPAGDRRRGAWLLGSSVISPNVQDVLIRVTFDEGYTRILSEGVAVLPTQLCKAHRLLLLNRTLLATELTSATVAQLVTELDSVWDRPTTTQPGDPS